MNRFLGFLGLFSAFITLGITLAEAKTLRATELTPDVWSKISRGELEEVTVEFRQGDEIPLAFRAEGDLLETKQLNPSTLAVKRSFWVRLEQNQFLLSLDGTQYKPFNESLSGSIQVGAATDQGGPANMITVLFRSFLK